jgi:uncharacterized membrane protein
MVFGASALIGFVFLLIGFYRRCDGMAVVLLIFGWALLVTGVAGVIAADTIYGG